MPPASRATRIPVALYHAVGPAGKSGTRLRRASEISLSTPGLDLATKLRVFQRALRGRIERRDALLDIVRDVGLASKNDLAMTAAACELVLEALVARKKISRTDAGRYGRAVQEQRRRPNQDLFGGGMSA